jgi:hypothetical protein
VSSHDHDLPFLSYLLQVLDETPRADVTARKTAEVLELDADVAEQVQARLLRRGLIEKRKAPGRLGDGILDFKLDLTPEGERAATRQELS